MSRLAEVIAAIDAANEADPERDAAGPAARVYGQRMSAELERLFPDASDALRIAARGQHIERWTSPRSAYPEGREGYLAWRRDLGAFHAARVGALMAEAGYDAETIAATGRMLRKEGIKRDAEVQALEDVICFTFLRWYFTPFAEGRDAEALERIVARTARKMSAGARARALAEFDLPEPFAASFRG
ncbi:MAG: DUF4202 domain-containing protein [Defluviimonas sp.]|uniref:DUF4202 domain-containing protein n=1 Tax=Albidovulum sp. TaxID=1872424 RepID=UPI001D449DD2|nr:DUF4202 domain-containing protein [Paracoccaceae bacterium]MCC0063873.1 DUF4202 domain-containing protein [Defluviimonas sp.]